MAVIITFNLNYDLLPIYIFAWLMERLMFNVALDIKRVFFDSSRFSQPISCLVLRKQNQTRENKLHIFAW